jgi:ArsR family transcriptional regulator
MRESQPKISKHLAKLRDMGFVTVERQEQYIFYNLNLREKIYIDILKNIIDNIKDYSVLKEDIKKSENAEKYIEECIKN